MVLYWILLNLNTSYVDIKLYTQRFSPIARIDLNTSYVDIKHIFEREYALAIIFKYILCWY